MSLLRQLFSFHGGLHLEEHKAESTAKKIEAAPIPAQLVIPLSQHIGQPAHPCVSVGDTVLKGQRIANADGAVSVPVHASSSGTVVAIEKRPVAHASGLPAMCIVIDTDGRDTPAEPEHPAVTSIKNIDPAELRQRIQDAGIVGLGGAGFPSYIKLTPGEHVVETLVLNAAECEPYITCDDMLMRERAAEVIGGLHIMQHALHAKHCLIGIEDNKVEAFHALQAAIQDDHDIEIVRVPTRYPAGGEKQLIYTLTGKQVPSQGRPLEIGIVCHNVGTAAAVYRAISAGEPLTTRIVTLTGSGIPQPRNLDVRIGTAVEDLLTYCQVGTDDVGKVLIGGPMMGFPLNETVAPVSKTCNCVLAFHTRDVNPPQPTLPCIRCGDCVKVCPAQLLPQQLYWHARAQEFDHIQDHHLFDCIECGCCDVVCPSHIPLVQYFRFAKTSIWQQERDKHKSDRARERHEFKLERVEREKQEKRERHNSKKAALNKDSTDGEDPKKAAILAAMQRVQAKKEQQHVSPKNTDHLTNEQQKKIDEIDARRADHKRAEQALHNDEENKDS